ncbi:hypothetical protein SAMN04489724_1593 [Algoriphagus locisalis]|uniref:Natural product n=1 Tax=Algoriphagus locisalis TaxID=305507 RepID=A0A1I7A0F8_9BACT|nr:hypothetical protein [Algoriphagus locisalis]SFT68400.1 hypothetical protein SAMN04489724_1593 [Algoriphagus locisalis]
MKKLLFGMAFMGAMMFSSFTSFGQASVDPDPGEGNSYGGVCCATDDDCPHPRYGLTAESEWKEGISYCP